MKANEIKEEAKFLAGWSHGKPIRHYMQGTRFYACGKWMTKLERPMVEALLAAGYAVGTVEQFSITKTKALLTKEAKGKEQGRLASEWVEANIL